MAECAPKPGKFYQAIHGAFVGTLLPLEKYKQRHEPTANVVKDIVAQFKSKYNDPTDPICDAARVTKIWRARDEVDHQRAQEDAALCVQESERRNAVAIAKQLVTNNEINGIIAEGVVWRNATAGLLSQRTISSRHDLEAAETAYTTGRALYLRVRHHAHDNEDCEQLNNDLARGIDNLVQKCIQEEFAQQYCYSLRNPCRFSTFPG